MKEKFYLFLSLLIIFFTVLMVGSNNWVHFPYGDGVDYVLMSESIHQHESPDLRHEDADFYIKYIQKRGLPLYKGEKFFEALTIEPGVYKLNYFTSEKDNRLYNYHFWFYSLLNEPSRAFLEHLKGDITASFMMTNLLIILFGVWMIFQLTAISLQRKILLSLLMIFSPQLWYIDWAHTEVYSSVLIFLGLLYFFESRWYMALLFASLAAVQNQALLLVAVTIGAYILYKDGINPKVLLKATICGIWGVIPMLFFYYHFGDYSLIDGEGYLESYYMSWKRVWSFFFDINQGMIVGMPLVMIVLIYYLINDLLTKKIHLEYLFLIPLFLMLAAIIQTVNWNHGAVVMNRYAVWCGVILLIVFERRIRRIQSTKYYILISLAIITQGALIFSQHDYNKIFWSSNELNDLTRYIWKLDPDLYDPEPQIFRERVFWPETSFTDSVKVYCTADNEIVKMQVNESSIDQLKLRGIDPKKVDSIKAELNYLTGYAYLNRDLLEELGYDQDKDTLISYIERKKRAEKIENYVRGFRASPVYMQSLEKEANNIDSLVTVKAEQRYNYEIEKYWQKKSF